MFDDYNEPEFDDYEEMMNSILERCLESGDNFDHAMGECLAGF